MTQLVTTSLVAAHGPSAEPTKGASRRSPLWQRAAATATTLSFLATTLGVVPAALADAPKKYRVAVVDVGGNNDGDSTDIHYFVEKGLRMKASQLESSAIDQVLNAGGEANDLQNIAFGLESLQTGRTAFLGDKCDDALDALSQAATYFEQSFAFLDEPDPYFDALAMQAVCLDKKGNKSEALAVLEKALVVQPELDLSAYPGITALGAEATQKVKDRELSSIAVNTKPDGSRVFVDGRFRGVSPAYRPGLRRGLHFVHVERQGFARKGLVVDTSHGDADATVTLIQEPAKRRGILDTLLPGLVREFTLAEAPKDGAILRLKSALLVDYAILLRASGQGTTKHVELSLFDLTSGRRINKVDTTVDWEAREKPAKDAIIALAQTLVDVKLQEDVAIVIPTPVTEAPTGPTSTPYYKTWWFWTLIGVGVAGTAVGVTFAVLPKDSAPAGLPQDGNGAILLRF